MRRTKTKCTPLQSRASRCAFPTAPRPLLWVPSHTPTMRVPRAPPLRSHSGLVWDTSWRSSHSRQARQRCSQLCLLTPLGPGRSHPSRPHQHPELWPQAPGSSRFYVPHGISSTEHQRSPLN